MKKHIQEAHTNILFILTKKEKILCDFDDCEVEFYLGHTFDMNV